MAASYYVRIQGRMTGPFSSNHLQDMKSRGQLHKFHEISSDRVSWYSAAQFADLFPDINTPAKPRPAAAIADDYDVEMVEAPGPARPRPANRSVPAFVIVAAILMLVSGAVLGIYFWQKDKPFSSSGSITSNRDEEALSQAIGLVACGVEVTGPRGDRWIEAIGTGTCFAVSPAGHLITNKHVVEQIANLSRAPILKKIEALESVRIVPKIWVFLNKKKYEAEIVSVSEDHDLSILKIATDTPSYFQLSSSDKVQRQTEVVACGFPGAARTPLSEDEFIREIGQHRKNPERMHRIDDYFKPRDLVFSSSKGTVGRMEVEEKGRVWIQHDASISTGNSGGPLVGSDGAVLGINTQIVKGAPGIYSALSLPQLRSEIDKHVPKAVWK